MSKWYVKAIQVGSISAVKSGLTHFRGSNIALEVPLWIAAATNGELKVLIDTGIGNLDDIVNGPEPNCHQLEAEQTPIALKNAMGWNVEDVDIVINTHLHFDHCGCNNMFRNAKFYVQRTEMDAAYNPIPGIAFLYCKEYFDRKAVSYFNWILVDGEYEIAPGLKLFPTPGHSVGHQSVLLDTDQGSLCVAGDIVSVIDNINDNIETNIVVNTKQVYESFDSIRRKADRILPGHEPTIKNLCDKDFPEIK